MKKKLLLSSLWALILVYSVELALSKMMPQRIYSSFGAIRGCFMSDPILYTVHRQNTVCNNTSSEFSIPMHIDAQGFRKTGHETVQNGAPILVLGDSYTFGHGVFDHEAYPAVLEQKLRANGNPVHILNAGISGVGLDWYYLFLKERATRYSPKAVVVGIFLGNDLFDHTYFDSTSRNSNGLPEKLDTTAEYVSIDGSRNYTTTPTRYRIPILRDSHLFQLMTKTLGGAIQVENANKINGSLCFFQMNCREIDTHITHAKTMMRGMRELTDSMNVPIIFVFIPWEAQFPRRVIQLSQGKVFAVDRQHRFRVNTELMTFCQENQLHCVDLLPAFEQYSGTTPVYYPIDTHWTAKGHEIAAEYLTEKLETILFPPRDTETE